MTILAGCDPERYHTLVYTRHSTWDVKNSTDKNLYISWKFSGKSRYEELLLPGHWCRIGPLKSTIPYVEADFEDILSLNAKDGDITVSLYSEDKSLLKMWKWSERYEPGRQLFDESLWEKSKSIGDNNKLTNTYWQFYILPEDIGQREI